MRLEVLKVVKTTMSHKTGLTILVIEQNAGRALGFADRTYVINGGQIRLQGPSAELADAPGFEAAYFGYGG